MALTSEDIWQKFDLFNSDKLDLSKLDIDDSDPSLISSTVGKKAGEHDNFKVPDIMDILSDFSLGINFMDGGIDMAYDNFLDDILSMEKEPLRHDCMWSGQCPSDEHQPYGQRTVKPVTEPAAPLCNVNFDVSAKSLSCFDTPLSSETSDLDETSSDIDETDSALSHSRLQPAADVTVTDETSAEHDSNSRAQDFTFSDHCYVATSVNSRGNQSSETGGNQQSKTTRFRIPTYPCTPTAIRYKKTPVDSAQAGRSSSLGKSGSPAKFKFHMKFKKSKSGPNSSRSVLRQPTKPQRRFNKSGTTVQFPSSRYQISPTRVLSNLDENRKVAGGEEDAKRWSKGGNRRDVRDMHNILERQRRIDLKNAFDTLKSVVPDLRSSEKASKLLILTKATDYCRGLVTTEGYLRKDIESQKLRRQALMRKLRSMQSSS